MESNSASPAANGSAVPASAPDPQPRQARQLASVRVDASHLASSYANVVTANSTREEVVVTFGLNQDWDRAQPEMAVALHTRVVMNPHAAKRLHARLTQLLADYDTRFGGPKS